MKSFLLLLLPALAAQFQHDVRILASDRMEGRGLGTQGLERAADWVETGETVLPNVNNDVQAPTGSGKDS